MGDPLTVFAIGDIDELGIRGVVLRGSDPETIRDAGKNLHRPVVVVPVERWQRTVEALEEWLDAEDTWDGDLADDERIARAKDAARAALSRHGEGK